MQPTTHLEVPSFPAFPRAPAYGFSLSLPTPSAIVHSFTIIVPRICFPSRLLLFDVVGRRQRFPSPHLLKAKFPDFCSMLDFYLFRLPSTDSTVMQKRSPLLFFRIPVWSSRRPLHSRRKDDLCYPTHHIARFLTVPALFLSTRLSFPLSYGLPLPCQ